LIYSQSDIARGLVGYGVGRNEVMLLSKPEDPASYGIEELQVPVVVNVEILHLAYVPIPRVKTVFWRSSWYGGAGCSWCGSRVRFMRTSFDAYWPLSPLSYILPTFPSFMDYKLHSGSAALGPSCGLYYELDRAGLDSRKFPARLYVLGPLPLLALTHPTS
jgi:hypothetical protein